METYKEQSPTNPKGPLNFLEEISPLIQKELADGRKEKKAHHDVTHHNVAASYLRALINEINKDIKNSQDTMDVVEKVREIKPRDPFNLESRLAEIKQDIYDKQYHAAVGHIHGLLRQMKKARKV